MFKALKRITALDYRNACIRSNDWCVSNAIANKPSAILDVGCQDGLRLAELNYTPKRKCGVEPDKLYRDEAINNGLEMFSFDLNCSWPMRDCIFDVIMAAQVIEHLHNTRLFVSEIYRVLKPGGTAYVTSENLTSLLNLMAIVLGYAPFSTVPICGLYLGNPLTQHLGETIKGHVQITDPIFSGITGHVRVMAARQAEDLFNTVGFETHVSTIGLMPLPSRLTRWLEVFLPRRGHFMNITAHKPHQ